MFSDNLRASVNLVAFGGAGTIKDGGTERQTKKAAIEGSRVVVPGGEVRITIPVSAAAGPKDGSKQNSVAYIYGSNVDYVADINAGWSARSSSMLRMLDRAGPF